MSAFWADPRMQLAWNLIEAVAKDNKALRMGAEFAAVMTAIDQLDSSITDARMQAVCPDDGNLLSEDGVCGFCGNAPEADDEPEDDTCALNRQPISRCQPGCDHGWLA